MRKLLNILYIITPNAYLSKDGLNIVMSVEQKETFRIPIHNIEGIMSFSYMGMSPGAMKLCMDNNVHVSFMSPNSRFISHLQGGIKGNVLLRLSQYKQSLKPEFNLMISKRFIGGKIHNQRAVLQRYLRDYGEDEEISKASAQLKRQKAMALDAQSIEDLRGIEGYAANIYFGIFNKLIVQQKDVFEFSVRTRRPPKDEVNVLLSFAYSLIEHEVSAGLESVGIDPYVGFMHTLRPGRPSLSLDLMEELRPFLGDRFVLSIINRRQISREDFIYQSDESLLLTDNGRRKIIAAWQTRKNQEFLHPYFNEKIPIGLLSFAQAKLLSKFIREDIDDYPVFLVN